ncbi:MAG: flavin reductase family protein [Acidobacteria bacterium]|nr:flavin reductase family protein [Acidobacteriota bacterium]MCA1637910.1 flavin reductase family protein [Acidobacteriota bacterium]
MAIGRDEFRAALAHFASGVTVVTTRDDEGYLHGITVSAFCSLSLNPPLILICIDKRTGSHYAFTESKFFVVNILHEKQQHYADRFASNLPNKFERIEFLTNAKGIPILKDALVNLECELINSYNNGDHTIFVGQIERTVINDGKPLIYFSGNYHKIKR